MKQRPSEHPTSSGSGDDEAGPSWSLLTGFVTKSLITVTLLAALFACRNDMDEVRLLEFNDTIVPMVAHDVEMIYSERGEPQIRLVSPLLVRSDKEQDFLEFPEGFVVYFYDSLMQVKSQISADYGISFEKKRLMVARYNVVVDNFEKDERLDTEELFWDQARETIYSEKFVKITRGEEVITGDGLTADQTFETIEIDNPQGLIEVEDEGTE